MAQKIQLRRDTAANWASSDPTLSEGEFGLETDTGKFKIGDGTTPWKTLAYWTPNTINGASKLVSICDTGFGSTGSTSNTGATSTAGTSEIIFTVSGVYATNITAQWDHYYTPIGTPWSDTDPAGSIVFSASLKVVSSTNPGTTTGQIYRLTFGGRTTVTLDPGGSITADLLGLSLAPGDVVAVRTYLSSGTAYARYLTAGGIGFALGGFTSTTDLTAPGSAAISTSFGYYYGPSVLLGHAQGAGNAKSVLMCGDSNGGGYGDFYNATAAVPTSGGFALRALRGVGGLVNIAVYGDEASTFQATNGSFRRLRYAHRCNSAIIEYGSNDFASSISAATVETANLNIATSLLRLGITKVFLTTIPPRTTSTDGWATTGNQTAFAGETARVAYNTWVRANAPVDPTTKAPVAVGTSGALLAGSYGHPITAVFDTAAQVESALNSGKWLAATRVATGSMTASSGALTSSTANFLTANQESGGDKGAAVILVGAGPAGANLQTYIETVSSGTATTVLNAASTTVTSAVLNIGVATTDGAHASPRGHYLMSQAINTTLM